MSEDSSRNNLRIQAVCTECGNGLTFSTKRPESTKKQIFDVCGSKGADEAVSVWWVHPCDICKKSWMAPLNHLKRALDTSEWPT